MKSASAALVLFLSGCGGPMLLVRAPEVSEPACTATCNAHYDQCPQVFANFPERGAVECPAEHNQCLKACKSAPAATPAPVPPAPAAAPGPAPPPPAPAAANVASAGASKEARSKEARLRELKHFYEEGLVTEDVYRERQTAILGEP
jgi:pyruvate/2-oxoglutarate dehydrogenase complex dihydrolipoamide acyltransferase (E2) component